MKRSSSKQDKSAVGPRRVPQVSPLRPGKPQKPAFSDSGSRTQLVQIEKPIYGGNFLARQEGKAIFVPFALPGEQARIRIIEDKAKRGYAVAELEEIVVPAPERVAPRCRHFGPCGGCQYQHTDYATQLNFKQAVLRETLERAGIVPPGEFPILAAEPWAYRNRIRVAFDAAGNAGYRGRRSHAIIGIRECPIAAPLLVRAALAAAELTRQFAFRPTELALFCNAAETALLASFFTSGSAKIPFDAFAAALQQRIPEFVGAELVVESSTKEPRTVAKWGTTSLTYSAAGADYRVDHGAFFQVNRWLIDKFAAHVVNGAAGELAWDLFAGVGLFARLLASTFRKVVAVESAPAATALAANLAGTTGEAVNASTLAFLRDHHRDTRPDLIIVDPPRTGLGPDITSLLVETAAPVLTYVSCDPATLARDLRVLLSGGYSIQSVALADLFPQTFHLETVVHLSKH